MNQIYHTISAPRFWRGISMAYTVLSLRLWTSSSSRPDIPSELGITNTQIVLTSSLSSGGTYIITYKVGIYFLGELFNHPRVRTRHTISKYLRKGNFLNTRSKLGTRELKEIFWQNNYKEMKIFKGLVLHLFIAGIRLIVIAGSEVIRQWPWLWIPNLTSWEAEQT